jgi:hypothetical protein
MVRIALLLSLLPVLARAAEEIEPVLDPTIKSESSQAQETVIFQTTTQVWRNNKRRVIPEPVAQADLPPQPIVVTAAVGIMDAMTGVVTIPWDLISSPFRKPSPFVNATWRVSGKLLDKAGHPRAYVPVTVTVDRFNAQRNASEGQAASAATHTDAAGAFAMNLGGRMKKDERAEISVYAELSNGTRRLESRTFSQ